jgi:hypothetical protein
MKYKETLLWRRSLDLAIAVNFLIKKIPENEREPDGIYFKLMEAAIRLPFKIAESYEPYFNDPEELLSQARIYLKQIIYLVQWSYEQGYFCINDKTRLDGFCSDLNEMIHKTIRRSLMLSAG